MCGRFTLTKPFKSIMDHFALIRSLSALQPRYNIAPTQDVAVVLRARDQREWAMMRWGLIPSWARDEKIGTRLINARAETVHKKPSFRHSFQSQRCLIPADGFVEWQKVEKEKVPYYIFLKSGALFAFAGIWAEWKGKETHLRSCAILTTETNSLIQPVHNRMPVILAPDQYDAWLDPGADLESLRSLLRPYPSEKMDLFPVSRKINSPRNEGPEVIQKES